MSRVRRFDTLLSRQTASFIEVSIEAGILLGGNSAVLHAIGSLLPMSRTRRKTRQDSVFLLRRRTARPLPPLSAPSLCRRSRLLPPRACARSPPLAVPVCSASGGAPCAAIEPVRAARAQLIGQGVEKVSVERVFPEYDQRHRCKNYFAR